MDSKVSQRRMDRYTQFAIVLLQMEAVPDSGIDRNGLLIHIGLVLL